MHPSRPRRFPRPRAAVSLILFGAASLLPTAGCFDNDPGLQERLVRTQAELQDKSRRVQELETTLEKARADARDRPAATPPAETAPTPAPAAAAIPAMLTREQLEETYVAAAKDMRQKVESGLTGYAVEKCTLFKVDMPSVALPYTSRVALNLRSSAGQPYRLEFPVGADWSGKWNFPTPGDVAATLEKAPAQAAAGTPRTPAGGATASAGGAPTRPGSRVAEGPAGTGVETIEMRWDGRRSPGGAAAAPRQPAAPEAPSPAAGGRPPPASPATPGSPAASPRPAMPSERDVLIQF